MIYLYLYTILIYILLPNYLIHLRRHDGGRQDDGLPWEHHESGGAMAISRPKFMGISWEKLGNSWEKMGKNMVLYRQER